MEENFEDDSFVKTDEGNKNLGKVCEDIFYTNGQIGYYMLSQRVAEPSEEFDNNFNIESEQDFCQ